MRLRTVVVILSFLLVAVFVAINWSAFVMPTTLSFAFTSVEAPLGIVMLCILVLFALAVAVYMALWQSRTLLDLRRHTKELHEQRALADQAEASRFTELRGVVHAEIERLASPQLVEPPAQDARIDPPGSAVDQDADRRGGVALVVEQQAVAVVGLKRFERELHVRHTD